jgi:hypothetical protein
MESLSSLTSSDFSSGSSSPSTAGFSSRDPSGVSAAGFGSSGEAFGSSAACDVAETPQQNTTHRVTSANEDNLVQEMREITDDGNRKSFMIRLSEVRFGNYDKDHCNQCIIGMQAKSVEFGSC